MKERLPLASAPLPKFDSDEAAAAYFETRSIAGVWDRLAPAAPGKLSKQANIQEQTMARKPSRP